MVSPSHFALLMTMGAGLTSALVVRTSGTGEVKIEEVKVSYGDELEAILHKAASDGNLGLVREIFNNEIDVLQTWVRKRAFDHIEQGVMLKGDNVQEAKLVVDKIKGILEETTELLVASRNEIFSFLQVIQFLETKLLITLYQESKSINSPISENLVNALKFIRSIYESTEQRYKDTMMSEI